MRRQTPEEADWRVLAWCVWCVQATDRAAGCLWGVCGGVCVCRLGRSLAALRSRVLCGVLRGRILVRGRLRLHGGSYARARAANPRRYLAIYVFVVEMCLGFKEQVSFGD